MNKRILVVSEVADLLRVKKQRVWELVRQGKLPVIRLGERQYRFSSGAIEKFLQNGGLEDKDSEKGICHYCQDEDYNGSFLRYADVKICSGCLIEIAPNLASELEIIKQEKEQE